MAKHPVLYSYRRCPYAMRARMAIVYAGIQVEQREIVFWDKPEQMLTASPKGTVPVLVLSNGRVIDESRDIMQWALSQANNQAWLFDNNSDYLQQMNQWIDQCDNDFKVHLDHYKYADRHPEFSQQTYRQSGCEFLSLLEQQLSVNAENFALESYALIENQLSMADIALFPFVRQFAHVDKDWFQKAEYPFLQKWLEQNIESKWFKAVMKNRPVWQAEHQSLWVDEPQLTTRDQFLLKASENL